MRRGNNAFSLVFSLNTVGPLNAPQNAEGALDGTKEFSAEYLRCLTSM